MASSSVLPTRSASWDERWLILGLVGTACALVWLGNYVSPLAQAALWAGLLAGTALLARTGRISILGPVFVYEMVRIARRRRYFWFRMLYVVGLFGLLGWLYGIWTLEVRYSRSPWRMYEMALFASSFFYVFMGVQYAIVVLLTPIYTAGTVAEEKDRKTIEFVLATDLRDHEIVLGKWLARLANLALLVLAGLPVLSFLQFQGGIDPGLMLAGFAATGVTMLSLGALGMFCSVISKKPRDAIVLTYLLFVLYHAISAAGWLVFIPLTGRRGDVSVADLLDFLPWDQIIYWLNSGNIASVLVRVSMTFNRQGTMDDVLAGFLRDFVISHGLFATVMLLWAVLRVRPVALRQAFAPVKPRWTWSWLRGKTRKLPPVGEQPVFWKEVYVERGLGRMHWIFRVAILLIILGSFLPAAGILYDHLYWGRNNRYYYEPWSRLGRDMNIWVRIIGTPACCFLWLAVAIRAAGSISGERDKQTLDGLVTTQLNSDTILLGKWLGSVLSVRWAWLWLAAIWAIGLATDGLHPLGVLLLPASWLLYAGVFALVGLWFSMTSSTSLKATIKTLLAVLLLGGGHWIVMGLFCYMPLALMRVRERDFEWLLFFQLGQTPPAVQMFEAVHIRDLTRLLQGSREEGKAAIFSIVGLLTWIAAGCGIWRALSWRFQALTGLAPLARTPGPRTNPLDSQPQPAKPPSPGVP